MSYRVRKRTPRRLDGTLKSGALPSMLGALVVVGAVSGLRDHDLFSAVMPVPALKAPAVRFALCDSGPRENCVVDGDTFWYGGRKVRIADIDTPELSPPRCVREKSLGEAARNELLEALNAGPIDLASAGASDTDRYGRLLRKVVQNGRSIGNDLVDKGLARPWTGSRRSWCD
ncbi:thermonuclease family protein [Rhizobium halophytocola]|uniref:Endonuclease YncB(Thermonuclease family) n=1 Tax=Rhizobium halophytocola TaxID=735519 RepID=A0ABS4DVR9_9HYPH|nr:thermonuclease family protein [Rhizobium halophytocola]MBP1849791.1 endonuclease YncB(thermonuclease family) [Rhizobium halophytocola]